MRSAARLVFLLTLAAFAVSASASDLDSRLKTIEDRYNKIRSLKLDFSQSYVTSRRPSQTESGVLYLRKPGQMRWEYSSPAGKLFLSDGKDTWLYAPEDHRVERASLKQTEDTRAPLAFLLGNLNFHKDFQSFETHDDWISALPKSQNLSYTRVDFQAGQDGQIHRVRVTGQDRSTLELSFSNEQLNAPVTPGLFAFHAPAGVEIVAADKAGGQN